VDKTTIHNWERNRTTPSLPRIIWTGVQKTREIDHRPRTRIVGAELDESVLGYVRTGPPPKRQEVHVPTAKYTNLKVADDIDCLIAEKQVTRCLLEKTSVSVGLAKPIV
jgi:hypothetical protein